MNTKSTVAVVGLCVLAACCTVRGEDNVRYDDVVMTVTVAQKMHLGSDVVFAISLESKSEQSLYSLITADLQIDVEAVGETTKKYTCNRGRRRRIEVKLTDGRSLFETINVKKQRVTMKKGDRSSIEITMLNDFNTHLSCGTYSVSALYEGKVKASTRFSVVVDYERTVPTLIDFIAGPDEWTRGWARNRLFSIVGQPTWKPSRADTQKRIDSEVGDLRKWWKENKDLILLVEKNSKQAENP